MMLVPWNVAKGVRSAFRIDNNTIAFSLHPVLDILKQASFPIKLNLKLRNQTNIYIPGSPHCVHRQES